MSKDLNATGRWLKKITQSFGGEPQDRADLISLWAGQSSALATREDAADVFDELRRGVPS